MFKSASEKYQANLDEEMLFGIVAQELSRNAISPGLYTKALAEVGGDETKARAQYILLRVSALRLERSADLEAEENQSGLEKPCERVDHSSSVAKQAAPAPLSKREKLSALKLSAGATVILVVLGRIFSAPMDVPIVAPVFSFLSYAFDGLGLVALFLTAAALGDYVFEDRPPPPK